MVCLLGSTGYLFAFNELWYFPVEESAWNPVHNHCNMYFLCLALPKQHLIWFIWFPEQFSASCHVYLYFLGGLVCAAGLETNSPSMTAKSTALISLGVVLPVMTYLS